MATIINKNDNRLTKVQNAGDTSTVSYAQLDLDIDGKVSKTGDTMSGGLTIASNSLQPLNFAMSDGTIKWSLGKVSSGHLVLRNSSGNDLFTIADGTTRVDFKGVISTPVPPTRNDHLTRKDYVDNLIPNKHSNYDIIKIDSGQSSFAFLTRNGEMYFSCGDGGTWQVQTYQPINNYNTSPFIGLLEMEEQIKLPGFAGKIVDFIFASESLYMLDDKNQLFFTGQNSSGQAGTDDTSHKYLPILTATDVLKLPEKYREGRISSHDHMIIQKTDGTIWGVGDNGDGQLGIDSTDDSHVWVQADVTVSEDCKIWLSKDASIITDGTKYYFSGKNNMGQAGDGTTTDLTVFTDLTDEWNPNNLPIIYAEATCTRYNSADDDTYYNQCSIIHLSDGDVSEVRMCGNNTHNQIGDGTTDNTSTPYLTFSTESGDPIIKQAVIEAELGPIAVLLDNGDLYKWGYNGTSAAGDGSNKHIETPELIISGVDKLLLRKGLDGDRYSWYGSSFIRMTDGTVMATGRNKSGVLGVGGTSTANVYTEVPGLKDYNISEVKLINSSTSDRTTVAISEDGKHLFGWGNNVEKTLINYTERDVGYPAEANFTKYRYNI